MAYIRTLLLIMAASILPATTAAQSRQEQFPPLRLLTEHSPPGMYLDEQGKVAGVTVDLIRILQRRLNEVGEIELLPWARAFELARSQANIALFETARSKDRENLFKWVGPLKLIQTALYGHSSRFAPDVKSAKLNPRLIACDYVNSQNISFLKSTGFDDTRNLILTSKHGECFNLFTAGKVDLIILNDAAAAKVEANLLAAGNSGLFRVNTLQETELYLAFSRDVSDDRIAAWQQALEQSYRDGTMRQLYQSVYSEAAITRLEAMAATDQPKLQRLIN
ncbi:MAG: transporter substrate-binding domain-containing protein [Gammaproteobacteria bacterium]|nr:transporter substrate-binding domain-containing protein [Gammaproteobacteria bacterium]MBU1553944.1 transporter substrate-binding domain-containing protein [Gammaproteobacteria bacterium]MBU2071605.1 transporter substrate-binding domain-containing protein [Gammaproteobacteria bacterium]MBU2182895.1 transporter substrate-binding domain-containing protein [Gammaproteobacteria bacterium]MBU2203459.1 transporter substrate-binding domain-containing protein [Gammaproteobacteria bacterium]